MRNLAVLLALLLTSCSSTGGAGQNVLFSSDGGATWRQRGLPERAGLFSVWATGKSVWVAGSRNGVSGILDRSDDHGETWVPGPTPTDGCSGVWASDAGDVWVVGRSGVRGSVVRLFSSSAGEEVLNAGNSARAIRGSSAQDVYALLMGGLPGSGDALEHTTNQGVTWTAREIPGGAGDAALWVRESGEVFLVGGGTRILSSRDGGATWKEPALPAGTPTLCAIWGAKGTRDLFAAGESGAILHSGDAGETWTSQKSGTQAVLWGIAGSGPRDVYAVGEKGTILHTSDGGTTWTAQASGVTLTLYAVACASAEDVYVVGDDFLYPTSTYHSIK